MDLKIYGLFVMFSSPICVAVCLRINGQLLVEKLLLCPYATLSKWTIHLISIGQSLWTFASIFATWRNETFQWCKNSWVAHCRNNLHFKGNFASLVFSDLGNSWKSDSRKAQFLLQTKRYFRFSILDVYVNFWAFQFKLGIKSNSNFCRHEIKIILSFKQ
jgi:hypothetical protein